MLLKVQSACVEGIQAQLIDVEVPQKKDSSLIPQEVVERKVYLIRGQKVMLDSDLATLYGVPTKRLNEQVKRNRKRFPADFMFQLTAQETETLRSQFATSKDKRGGRRTRPYVFTEQGVAMLSSVLNSERAIQVNIAIMRAFVRLREILAATRFWRESFGSWSRNTTSSSRRSLRRSGS